MMIPFDEKFPVHTETLTNVKDLNRIFNESVVGDKPVSELIETFNQIDSD